MNRCAKTQCSWNDSAWSAWNTSNILSEIFSTNCCGQTLACKIHAADHFRYFAPHCYGIVYLQKSVTTKQTFLKWSADNKFLLSTAIAGSSFGKETLNTAWIFSCSEEFPSSPSPRKCSVSSTNTEQLLHEQWRESFCRKQIHISSRLTVENAQPHERSTFRDEHPSPACD